MPYSQEPLQIRPATPDDAELVFEFILAIAAYEKLSHEVTATVEDVRQALSGPHPAAEVLLAFWGSRPAGFALFHHNFSTFTGRRGLYLEDIYVHTDFRGKGIGRILLMALVRLALERRCGRMEWIALDWNQSAIEFYEKLGARAMREWILFRLDAEGIRKLSDLGEDGAANGFGG